MISEQLQGDCVEDGTQQSRVLSKPDNMDALAFLDMRVCIGEYVQFAAAGADFL